MGFIVFIYYVYSIGNPKEGYSWDCVLNECVNSKKGWMWGGMCDIPHLIEKKSSWYYRHVFTVWESIGFRPNNIYTGNERVITRLLGFLIHLIDIFNWSLSAASY